MVVLAIPDTHSPGEHPYAWDFIESLLKTYKPDLVVHLGDEYDSHSISRYTRNPDLPSAGDELKLTIRHLRNLYDLCPKVKVCTSNHTSRPLIRAFEAGLPKAMVKTFKEFLQAPVGWEWKEYWEIDGVRYEHGDKEGISGQSGAAKLALQNLQSTVIGHIHSWAGVQYPPNLRVKVFGFNVGCLIQKGHPVFDYAKKYAASDPTLGAGIISDGIPQFVPMLLDKRGRFIRKTAALRVR